MRQWVGFIVLGIGAGLAVQGQTTQPMVAIHDSELTRALETMPATAGTPTWPGTTGFQWWGSDYHYFVMPESLKEAMRSDGTAFSVVGDSNIISGLLLPDGQPQYPILISLASEAIADSEIAALTNYVAAGGMLVVGSSAFTRYPDGTTRGDFAFANEMGVHMVNDNMANWGANSTVTKLVDHTLTSHLPPGVLTWRMPTRAEEISWGTSPSHYFLAAHDFWQVRATSAMVLAAGDRYPFLLIKPFGRGYFVYDAQLQPLIGHGGFAPTMYSYMIFRKAIEWAFARANLLVPRLSVWPYQYDAAFMVRHDLENYTNEIAHIAASALVEYTNGAKGDYYFCTGTLREDAASAYDTNAIIANLRQAVTNYGATIGPHNGGLPNPGNLNLVRGQYDYWHWGPDEILDLTPTNYPSGKAYALASLSDSFLDIESWLAGITNGPRTWVACYFNATREDSFDIQDQLGVKIAGDQKLTPFPHWTLSTRTSGKGYPILSEPVSDWFVGGLVAQSLEPWHPPGVHTTNTLHAAVDFYYNLGALINFYSHTLSTGEGDAGKLVPEYIRYGMDTNLHPRLWSANAVGVYEWWLQRSNAQLTVNSVPIEDQLTTTFDITGATDPNLAVEVLLPSTASGFQVLTNGVMADGSAYRTNGLLVRIQVGTAVTNAQVLCSLAPVRIGPELLGQPNIAFNRWGAVSVTNTAIDFDPPPVTLTYQLINAPAGAAISDDGVITWTPTPDQVPSINTFTTVVSDNGTPSLSATNLFTVTANPPGSQFQITTSTIANGAAVITWNSVPGQSYHLQYRSSLAAGAAWTDVLPAIKATEASTSFTNALGNATQRFYRVLLK